MRSFVLVKLKPSRGVYLRGVGCCYADLQASGAPAPSPPPTFDAGLCARLPQPFKYCLADDDGGDDDTW